MAPSIVVQGSKLSVRLRNATNRPAPAIRAFRILVDEVSKVNHIVHRVFASWVAKGIEEAKVVIGARIDGQFDCCSLVIRVWCSLCASNGAVVRRVTYTESVIVLSEGLQLGSFDLKLVKFGLELVTICAYLDCIINVRARVGSTTADWTGHVWRC